MALHDSKSSAVHESATGAVELPDLSERAVEQKLGTEHDQRDMVRMGKRPELRRNFQFFSIFGYAMILGSSWEWALATGLFSLTNGGTAGAIWMFVVCIFGMFFVVLSMAEMASMAPTAGGQYHWVSELAPRNVQKFLSFATGWLCVLGWQSSLVATAYIAAQQFTAIIAVCNPSYVIQGWHGTLFTCAVSFFSIACNSALIRKLPLLEGVVIVLHVFGFFAFVVVLWVMGPRGDSSTVTTFNNNGWGSNGLSSLVGILGPISSLLGADSSCHLSEELRNAAWVLPRSMIATALCNYVLGLVMIITLCFTLGDLTVALSSSTGMPYVEVVKNATNSQAATIVLTAVIAILMVMCTVNQVTTSSRQVRPGLDIPMNALIVTIAITVLLSLIIIGSPIAFNILTSLSLTGLLTSYLICVGCMFWRRWKGEHFPTSGRFSLGKAGFAVNIISFAFLLVAWVMLFFPTVPNPGAAGMNWSILIYGVVVAFFVIYYVVRARHVYVGPVEYVRKDI